MSDAYGTFDASNSASTVSANTRQQRRRWGAAAVIGLVGAAAFASYSYSTRTGAACTHSTTSRSPSAIQEEFLSAINRSSIREYLHAYSSSPHVCGTPQDYETAVYTAAQLESFGIDAEIKEYYTLLSSPGDQSLTIVDPPASRRELNLTEGTVANDTCTTSEDLWPGSFITYAASGNVTAPVVYANFGRPGDFDWLEAQNVSLAGKIALVRYGGNFRGLKVMDAENRGMAGVIIYSDPLDDGAGKGAVYPDGPWRPEDSFQRGSAQYLSLAGGDPLTPGWPSNKDAEYLDIADATSIPHIPVLALSSGQAKYILASLGGTKAPTAWQGGVALDGGYYAGNDDATVLNLFLDINNSVGPIWDVIGTLEGSEEPEKQVIIGNHRDAWTCGAVDPNSGSSVLLEIARILGGFARETGWRPRRTIKFASWDGEEFGLLGSTEYAEDHADELREGAIAYINVDAFLGHLVMASGSPAIAGLLSDAAKQVPANKFFGTETEVTLHDQWVVQQDALHTSLPNYDDGSLEPDRLVTLLGSGSDYTAYYQHLGIVSANLLFMNSYSVYGTYHSSMDSIMFSETIGDPDYTTHETLARWWGLVALRLAEDEVLPLNYSTYALVMSEKLDDLETQVVDTLQRDVNFTGLYASIARFSDATSEFDANITAYTQSDDKTAEQTLRLNDKLVQLERYLLIDEGLPHRPWYKHVVFGPGYFEGYSGTAFPGIADNIAFADNATAIQAHVDDVSRAVDGAVAFLLDG